MDIGRYFALFENRNYSSEFPLSWKTASVNRLYTIWVSDGAIMLPAILRSLDGMLSKAAAFLSFSLAKSLRTTLTGGSFREKVTVKGCFSCFKVGLWLNIRWQYFWG